MDTRQAKRPIRPWWQVGFKKELNLGISLIQRVFPYCFGILKNSEQCPFPSAEEAEVTEVEWVGRHPGAEEEKILENSRSHLGKGESVKLSPFHPLELPIIKKK